MTEENVLSRVRELRQQGHSPKQIAKLLGLPLSAVAPLVRQVAGRRQISAAEQTATDPADRPLIGCWINPGWSTGLGLDDAPEWAASDPERETKSFGMGFAAVLIARQERASRASVCGFLVDVYCLGVKNALGPLSMSSGSITNYSRTFYGAFELPPRSIPLDLAQHVVFGAVAYARTLGFEPHPDFAEAAVYLGEPPTSTPIQFGQDGKPFYISGPDDDPMAIMDTLGAGRGEGDYGYITHV